MPNKKRIFLILLLAVLGIKVYFEIGNEMYDTLVYSNIQEQFEANQQMQTKSVKIGDNTMFYNVSGKTDAPLVILLHPAFADHQVFDPQIEALAKEFRVITLDIIGHGNSQDFPGQKVDESVHYIENIVQAEGKDKVHLVGVSMGSLIAQYYAFSYPNRTLSLTAVGGYYIHQDNKAIEQAQNQTKFGSILRAIFSMKAFRRYAAGMSTNSDLGKAQFYKSAAGFGRSSFPKMSGLENIVKERDIDLPTYPHLIIVGDQDIDLAEKMAKEWHGSLPNSFYCEVENSGHCVNLDQPKEFNKILLNFLTQNSNE